MESTILKKTNGSIGALKRLSIQQRLPFFIFILLLTVILAFSWVSYIGVKNASIAIGTERLTTLVGKLSIMFKSSTDIFAASAAKIAGQKELKGYLISGSENDRLKALDVFQKSRKKDTVCKALQLLNSSGQDILNSGGDGLPLKVNIDSLTRDVSGKKRFMAVGEISLFKKTMYFPSVAPVKDKDKIIGYVVYWRVLKATQKNIDQFAQLLGSNGKMYFGNDDGQFWTDLVKPAAKPPVDLSGLQQIAQYSRKDGDPLMGSMRRIPNSRWMVLVELSTSSILKTANLFLRWLIAIGIIMVAVGSLGGWFLSRNITAPLNQLTKAASAIAEGDYSSPVDINRQDELGKLAESFNIMAIKVRDAQQQLEQKVQDRTKELQTAITNINDQKENEKKKDEFISIASHELKTPLTTVKAFFQLAKKEMDPELKSFNFVNKASGQLNRMENLIGDLLDVSKINAGKMQYNLEDFDFHSVLRDAIDNVQEISPNHTLVLVKSTSFIFNGDRHRIEQVITNLLNNAVKYSPGADKVLIQSGLEDEKVVVTVEDFGIGIAQEHISELFERFYRIDTQHRFQGLGLGLFISSEIIKRHGGNIFVESEHGKGSVFTFELPVRNKREILTPGSGRNLKYSMENKDDSDFI